LSAHFYLDSANTQIAEITGEFIPQYIKFAPLFGSLLAVALVFGLYSLPYGNARLFTHNTKLLTLYRFFSHK
jgi:hypothetical protein